MRLTQLTVVCFFFACAASAFASPGRIVQFSPVTVTRPLISGDGTIVCGSTLGTGLPQAAQWASPRAFIINVGTGDTAILSPTTADNSAITTAVSYDGRTIVGAEGIYSFATQQGMGVMWANGSPAAPLDAGYFVNPVAVSANGLVVGGRSNSGPALWTAAHGREDLSIYVGTSAQVQCLSSDGSIVGGSGPPFLAWTLDAQRHVRVLPFATELSAMSADGQIVFGMTAAGPAMWRPDNSMRFLSDGIWGGMARVNACSADGRVAVGYLNSGGPALWTARTGAFLLSIVARSIDPNYPGLGVMTEATAISSDGTTIVGWNRWTNSDNVVFDAWLLRLPTPCTPADIALAGILPFPDGRHTADDLIAFLTAFFGGNVLMADIAGLGGVNAPDGQLTADDVVAFLAYFFTGCP